MQKMNNSVLDDSRVGQLMLKLALPAFFGIMVMTLYNVVDTIFIGHYVGPLGIAGLSIVFPLQMLSFGIGQMTGMGGASSISRLIGAGNRDRAEHVLGNAIFSVVLLTVIITIAGFINTDFWLGIMGASPTILPYARDYFTIILIGIIIHTFGFTLNMMIVSEGNARVGMMGMIIGAVANIILDAIFIIPLDMGIKGAALATVLAQVISTAYLLRYYLSGRSYLKIFVRNLYPDPGILKAIFSIGIAAFATSLTGSLSAVLVNRALLAYGGDAAISAFGVINRIMMFAIMPGIVIGQGLQPVLGYNYGARRFDRALRAIKLGLMWATAWSVIVFIVLYFFPQIFILIFTGDAELISNSTHFARYVFLALYVVGASICGSIVFQAIGKPVQSFITSISRSFLFLIPLVLTLPRFWGVEGILLAFPLADGLAFILTMSLIIPLLQWFRSEKKRTEIRSAEQLPGDATCD